MTFSYPRGPVVLDRLDIDFPTGVTILLGPNGAGKSTLLALMSSAAALQTGSIEHRDLQLGRRRQQLDPWRRAVGWVPQRIDPIPGMTSMEQVAYLGWLRGLGHGEARSAAMRALDQVGLADRADTKVTALSGGQLRRVGIASALVHDCEVVIMDEPMAGLDPGQRRRLVRVVRDLPEVDWVISTHQTEDLAALDSHLVVLDHGEVVWAGSTADFSALGAHSSATDSLSTAYAQLLGEEA